MRVGCGLRVRRIDGNEYLYFWHYERDAGRSERREDYVGPAREAKSRQEATRKLLAFHRRGPQKLRGRVPRPRAGAPGKTRGTSPRGGPGFCGAAPNGGGLERGVFPPSSPTH